MRRVSVIAQTITGKRQAYLAVYFFFFSPQSLIIFPLSLLYSLLGFIRPSLPFFFPLLLSSSEIVNICRLSQFGSSSEHQNHCCLEINNV